MSATPQPGDQRGDDTKQRVAKATAEDAITNAEKGFRQEVDVAFRARAGRSGDLDLDPGTATKGRRQEVDAAFRAKRESGWSLPMGEDVRGLYEETLEDLHAYYVEANEQLYRLMEELGPGAGWEGKWEVPELVRYRNRTGPVAFRINPGGQGIARMRRRAPV